MVTLEELGLSREEILDRVVGKIAETLMTTWVPDEDGAEMATTTPFARSMQKKVQERVDAAVQEIADRHVLPNVAAYVEALCLKETNKWGEKTGRQWTFVEYLVDRAEKYMTEEVSYDGKTKGEQDSYSWKKAGTRIAYMVHKHLQYSIQTAMEHALKNANAAIVGGIEEAVKIKLAEVAATLKVKADIGR